MTNPFAPVDYNPRLLPIIAVALIPGIIAWFVIIPVFAVWRAGRRYQQTWSEQYQTKHERERVRA